MQTLVAHGVADDRIDVAWTPGAFEIPTVANRLAASGRYVAVHLPGGGDPRRNHPRPAHQPRREHGIVRDRRPLRTAGAVRRAHLQHAGTGHRPFRRPERPPRARIGADSRIGNKGVDCAKAALEMVDLMARLPKS